MKNDEKEVMHMPKFDGTGPTGQGPRMAQTIDRIEQLEKEK